MNNLPIWYLVLGGLLSIITVAGNGIVIYLIVTRHRLHTTANWFILSLAIADLILGLSYFLTSSLSNVLSSPTRNYIIWYAIVSFLAAASATNLCLLTLDRYIAIVKPLKYVTFMTTRRVVLLISTAWLASFLPHFVLFLRFVVFTTPNENPNERLKVFMIFDCVVFETLPIVILPFATGHLFLVARRHWRQTAVLMAQLRFNQRIQDNNKTFARNRETSAAKMIAIAVTVFVICYVNELCYTFLYQLPDRKTQPNEVFFYMMELLYIINSAVNPVVYAFFKKDIKKTLRNMFHCTRGTNQLQPRAFRTERNRVAARESTV